MAKCRVHLGNQGIDERRGWRKLAGARVENLLEVNLRNVNFFLKTVGSY